MANIRIPLRVGVPAELRTLRKHAPLPYLDRGRFTIVLYLPGGIRKRVRTRYDASDYEKALADQHLRQSELDAQAAAAGLSTEGGISFNAYCNSWLAERTNDDKSHDESRLRVHVLPRIGGMVISQIRPRHIRTLLSELRNQQLASRTIRNVYYTMTGVFRQALIDELITATPCVFSPELPSVQDADPEWRANNYFTRKELRILCSPHPWIEIDSTVSYALMGLAGLRPGEATALRWRNYDEVWHGAAMDDDEVDGLFVLGRLVVARSLDREYSKTGETRFVPVHPALALVLTAWKQWGWEAYVGRPPTRDDHILPCVIGSRARGRGDSGRRSSDTLSERIKTHLEALGWRDNRDNYTLRHTFLTMCQNDGAVREVLRRATHKVPRSVMDGYTRVFWSALCTEVAKLRMDLDHRHGPLGMFRPAGSHFPVSSAGYELLGPGRKRIGQGKGYVPHDRKGTPNVLSRWARVEAEKAADLASHKADETER